MNRHRFSRQPEAYRLPQTTLPTINPGAFIICPVVLVQGLPLEQQFGQGLLYRLAFEQAQAALRPSLPERNLLAVWN
jgi:hypothetical protein